MVDQVRGATGTNRAKQATAMPAAGNWRQQQKRFDAFREEYNEIRPHEALGQVAPRKYYQPSVRVYPERLPEVSYEGDWQVRRVTAGGQIRWRGESVFVSHALAGEMVGLEQEEEEQWRVWFSFYEVGLLDGRSGKVWNLREWKKRHRPKAQ